MKYLFILFISVFVETITFGQRQISPAIFRDSTKSLQYQIRDDISEYIQMNKIDSINVSGYLRFKVSSGGKAMAIACTGELQEKLGLLLTQSLLDMKGAWIPAIENGIPSESEYFLLPVSVSYNIHPLTTSISAFSFSMLNEFSDDTLHRNTDTLLSIVAKRNFYNKEVPKTYYHLNPVEIFYDKKYPPRHNRLSKNTISTK